MNTPAERNKSDLRRNRKAPLATRTDLNAKATKDIAAAMNEALAKDGRVAPDMRPLAERQYSDRLHGYREAFFSRDYGLAGQLFDSYLATYSGGKFRDSALTSALSAHVRSGDMRRAEAVNRDIKIKDAGLLKNVDSADLAALGRAIADRNAMPDG